MSRRGYGHHSFLNEYIRRNESRRIMEVGVANGDNAVSMVEAALEVNPPDEVEYYGFDTFEATGGAQLESVREKLSKTGCRFELFEGNSVETLPKAVDGLPNMDLIFIDGGRDYPVVKSDWENSRELMEGETAVFFHNYDYSGVKKLVDGISREKYSVKIVDPPSDDRTARIELHGK